MGEPMRVVAEVWPVAADEAGLWLLSGAGSWQHGCVPADGDVHFEVESLLWDHEILPEQTAALHSTSWRPDGPSVVLTYVAVVKAPALVRDLWPDALPVAPELAKAVGNPPTHAAAEAPVPRDVDVLLHGLRHLSYLAEPGRDAETSAAMGETFRRHLKAFTPALAGMYSQRHRAA